MQVDGSLDRWIDKKPEERSITLLVTVGHFKMPGPEEVRRLEREGSGCSLGHRLFPQFEQKRACSSLRALQ